ncbi:MAG: Rrf2 family transcriptional regulator, partial [Xanthobacteraceae bacterium]
ISVAAIVRIAEATNQEGPQSAPPLVGKVVAPAVAEAEASFETALAAVTIDRLCQTAERSGLTEPAHGPDFNI